MESSNEDQTTRLRRYTDYSPPTTRLSATSTSPRREVTLPFHTDVGACAFNRWWESGGEDAFRAWVLDNVTDLDADYGPPGVQGRRGVQTRP